MTPEQGALLAKAHRSVESAKALTQRGDYDFAASRAYYAMFYAAVALLLQKGLSFPSHSAVSAAIGEHFAKAGLIERRFHRYLIDGQLTRAKSDYEIAAGITEAQAAEQIAHAEQFIAAAEQLLKG